MTFIESCRWLDQTPNQGNISGVHAEMDRQDVSTEQVENRVEMTALVGSSGNKDHVIDDGNTIKEHAALLPLSMEPSSTSVTNNLDNDKDAVIQEERTLTLQRARRLLYLSHLFAQFSEVSWQFCLTVFLAALTNYQSLMLVSTYGLTTGLAVTLLGSSTGSLIDRTNRLVAARGFIFTENFCVILATICCFLLLSPDQAKEHQSATQQLNQEETTSQQMSGYLTDFRSLVLIVGIHILGAAARVLDEGFLVAMERDWVVVMSHFANDGQHGDNVTEPSSSRTWLSDTNVAMKQIDLSCKVVAPAISGFLIAIVDNRVSENTTGGETGDTMEAEHAGSQLRYAALAVGAINVLALIVEYYCTTIIYRLIPDLAFLKSQEEHDNHDDNPNDDVDYSSNSKQQETRTEISSRTGCFAMLPYGARVYLEQKTSLAGIGLAMLYLNALTFDAIFTAYLVWRGMKLETIGTWRGISSAIGLLGTCVYHWSIKRMTIESTGLWSIIYEFLCLSLSYVSLFVDDNHASLTMLIAGVCASRVGLWVFDIAVTQMMQEYIPNGVRGVVGGVQQSLNAFFNLLSYALGIVFPNPRDFYVYVGAGYASVGVAMLLYSFGMYSKKNETRSLE